MAENLILPFAQGTGANVLSQADYSADSQRIIGNQPGVARSNFVNKALLQSTVMASGLAQFIANHNTDDVTDELVPSRIAEMLETALATEGTNYIRFPSGLTIQWDKNVAVSGQDKWGARAVTFPIAFTSDVYSCVATVQSSVQYGRLIVYAANFTLTSATITCALTDTNLVGFNTLVQYIAIGK